MVLWPWLDHRSASLTASMMVMNSSCSLEVVVADVLNARIGNVIAFSLKGLGCFAFGVVVRDLLRVFNLRSQRDILWYVLLVEDVVDEGVLASESRDNAGETKDTHLDSLHSCVLITLNGCGEILILRDIILLDLAGSGPSVECDASNRRCAASEMARWLAIC